MSLPDFSMRQLLEAGVHFGHQTHRWNPKMDKFIFGQRNGVHILDLSQTVPLLHAALKKVSDTVADGGHVLFVGTKRSAAEVVANAARSAGQPYVNARWLHGMMVNWKTIFNSIKRLDELDNVLSNSSHDFEKKEILQLNRERDKLERALGGVRNMSSIPELVFLVDTNKEFLAIEEARKLGIPVCAIVDSNSDPEGIDFPIPGNDDATRAISLYCDLVAKAAIDGAVRSTIQKNPEVVSSPSESVEHSKFDPDLFEQKSNHNSQEEYSNRTGLNSADLYALNVTQKRIVEHWGETIAAHTAVKIIENIKKSANFFDDDLHFEHFLDFFDDSKNPEDIFSALNILCNSNFHVFEVNFIFFDEEQKHRISLENYRYSASSGRFTHPSTSSIVDDFEAKLFPVFSLVIKSSIRGTRS